MLLDRLDEHLDAGHFHLAELDGQRGALLGGDAAGAAVGDVAGGVEGAEIAADGHVLRPQLEAHAGGLQGPAADQVLDRVVAEQGQVSGPAAGGNARGDGIHASLDPVFCQGVQIGGLGGLQFRRPARLDRQPAQPVGHQHARSSTCSGSSTRGPVVEYPLLGLLYFPARVDRMIHGSKRRERGRGRRMANAEWRSNDEGMTKPDAADPRLRQFGRFSHDFAFVIGPDP